MKIFIGCNYKWVRPELLVLLLGIQRLRVSKSCNCWTMIPSLCITELDYQYTVHLLVYLL